MSDFNEQASVDGKVQEKCGEDVAVLAECGVNVTLRRGEREGTWLLKGAIAKDGLYSPTHDVHFQLDYVDDKWTTSSQSMCYSVSSSRALASLMIHMWRYAALLDEYGCESAMNGKDLPYCTWDNEEVVEHLMEYGLDCGEAFENIGSAILGYGEFIIPRMVLSQAEMEFEKLSKQCKTGLKAIEKEREREKKIRDAIDDAIDDAVIGCVEGGFEVGVIDEDFLKSHPGLNK